MSRDVPPRHPVPAPDGPALPGDDWGLPARRNRARPDGGEARRRRRRRQLLGLMAVAAVSTAAGAVAATRDGHDPVAFAGLVEYEVGSRNHVEGTVSYPQSPPVGGDHDPVWMGCAFYDSVVDTEKAVHSMEHGAVWITYRPGLPERQLAPLRRLAEMSGYLLVSPYPDLPSPLVASAWGVQIRLQSSSDSRLGTFLDRYRAGPQAPEPGNPCTGGAGR